MGFGLAMGAVGVCRGRVFNRGGFVVFECLLYGSCLPGCR
jgi:hypothetical protein